MDASTPTGTGRSSTRDLLVALNSTLELPRQVVCELARRTPRWLDEGWRPHPGSTTSAGDLVLARSVARSSGAIARRESRRAAALDARLVTLLDDDYPTLLYDLDLPPPVLYVRGALPRQPALAIVGSRRAYPYGLEASEMFGRALAEAGMTIVSGLARGVDAAAHRGALDAVNGTTVAVQARGLDETYPREHRRLAERIAERGAVISEFPVGTRPLPRNFPIRNRIIAALSVGVLVVQAAARSGSLITARLGLELGREVFAVPGPIFLERAQGTNRLLADGALLVQRPRDVLEALPLAVQDRLSPPADNPPDATPPGPLAEIVAALSSHQSLSPEELARMLSRPVREVLTSLLQLELGGRVRRYPGPVFHLKR